MKIQRKASKCNVTEGDIIAVRLEGGGYARAVIAAVCVMTRARSRIALYGFAPAYSTITELKSSRLSLLKPESCTVFLVTDDAALRTGKWSCVGRIALVTKDRWVLPCVASDAVEPWCVMSMDTDALWGDIGNRYQTNARVASRFAETGWAGNGYVSSVLKQSIVGRWKGRRPIPGVPKVKICLEPWPIVKKKYKLRVHVPENPFVRARAW